MSACPSCGQNLHRIRRTFFQRISYAEVTTCLACGERVYRIHPSVSSVLHFVFSRYTRCVECGNYNVRRLAERDRVDRMSKSAFSWWFRLTRGQLHKCDACRLQYYDWRPKQSD